MKLPHGARWNGSEVVFEYGHVCRECNKTHSNGADCILTREFNEFRAENMQRLITNAHAGAELLKKTDKEIAALLFMVLMETSVLGPQYVVIDQAYRRLLRSEAGELPDDD